MRKAVRIAWVCAVALAAGFNRAGETPAPSPLLSSALLNSKADALDKADLSDDMSAPANYDEVVHDLVDQMLSRRKALKAKEVIKSKKKVEDEDRDAANEREQFTVNAQDAARKLASLGKRAVPDLALLFKANYNRPPKEAGAERAAQVAYYAAWALARIRTAEASRTLIPLMITPSAPPDLRLIAVDAAGWEKSESGIAVLEKVATGDPDLEMRKHALGQLSMIPEFWALTEPIFVRALSDPNEDIRVQAAKACHFSHMFASANPKLLELLEKDPSPNVRLYAMLTLARLRVVKAEPALMRVLQQPNADEKVRKQALAAIVTITDIPFRNVETALAWWEKKGRTDLEVSLERDAQSNAAADPATPFPIKSAPKRRQLDEGASLTGALLPADAAVEIIPAPRPTPAEPAAEVVPLEKTDSKESTVLEAPKPSVQAPPAAVPVDPPDELLSPNESTGSQRRRLRKAQEQGL